MPQGVGKALMRRFGAASAVAVLAFVVGALGGARAEELAPSARESTRMAQQLPRYSASGTHQCGSGNSSCIVSGQFGNCNDATISLRTRDCCPTTRNGGSSTGFTLNYCIPEMSPR